MTCEEARPLIQGYADAELDLASSLEIERHLAGCTACAAAYRQILVLRAALRAGGASFAAPAALRTALGDVVSAARHAERARLRSPMMRRPLTLQAIASSRTAAMLAAAAVLLMIVLAGVHRRVMPTGDDLIGNEIVASHVRSLMVNHLADVISSNQHTVKPWFDGKIDFAPTVSDFAAQGFALSGGRLDYVDGRPVAALIYRRREHIINLFTWPIGDTHDRAPSLEKRQGYNLVHWIRAGMEYWAVSNLNGNELMKFAGLVRDAAAPAPG